MYVGPPCTKLALMIIDDAPSAPTVHETRFLVYISTSTKVLRGLTGNNARDNWVSRRRGTHTTPFLFSMFSMTDMDTLGVKLDGDYLVALDQTRRFQSFQDSQPFYPYR